MTPENLFHSLLGLGTHWCVKELDYLKGRRGEFRIVIASKSGLAPKNRTPFCYDLV